MRISSEEIRRQYCAYLTDHPKANLNNCPQPVDLFFLIRGSLPSGRKRDVLKHLGHCPLCTESLREFIAIEAGSSYLIEKINIWLNCNFVRRTDSKYFWAQNFLSLLRPVGFFLLGLTALLTSFIIFFSHEGQIPQITDQIRGNRAIRWQDASPAWEQVSKNRLIFKWPAFSGLDHYIVELFDSTMNLIWSSPKLNDNYYSLSTLLMRKFEVGSDYFWLVKAVLKNGSAIESPLFTFQLSD